MNPKSASVLAIGSFLPPEVRTNDWWPQAVVDKWKETQARHLSRAKFDDDDVRSEGARLTMQSMLPLAEDVFKGTRERRVMPDGMVSSDMELAAAEEAIRRAGIAREEIGLLMVYSQLPDYFSVPNSTLLHKKLSLRNDCMALGTESACNAFMHQYSLAEKLIRTGAVRYALLVQSAGAGHSIPKDEQHSLWFGDGATAVIVGPAADGDGILGEAHFTDGSYAKALLTGSPGKRWWQGDPVSTYVGSPIQARKMLMMIADLAKQSIHAALQNAKLRPEDVNYYATHQSTAWFRQSTQAYAGLTNARSMDSFSWTASMAACNVPFVLELGEREGLLSKGDIVAMHSGGSGTVYSGLIVRWGS